MRQLIIALLLAIGLTGATRAYDDPKALLDAVYAPYTAGQTPGDREQYFSARLKGLYAANLERRAVDGETGKDIDPNAPNLVGFDPFIEGDHALLLDLMIGAPVIQGDRALSTVTFHNFDHTSLLAITMKREQDGWKVDDIASMGSDENWLLSWLLQYDPFGVN
jgi:hypothetical protein